ncbi:hypothetical protein AARAC_001627 [Aspergillus arachidicola]|uniref:Uncharacterized protein n=1 Tax=Aspergillus arachidicola TaxID=656916 RepID=A0A2G7FIK8_9EURO|nr:hypothetical protein AARAC_001627 [Aspergillus arachidicola]
MQLHCSSVPQLGVDGRDYRRCSPRSRRQPLYPLGGLIASGTGNTQFSFMKPTPAFINVDTDHVLFPLDKRDVIMFKLETTVPEVVELCDRLNAVSPLPKIVQFPAVWPPVWKETHMSVPVMFTLVEDDPFFVADNDELEISVQAFKKSVRVDGSFSAWLEMPLIAWK